MDDDCKVGGAFPAGIDVLRKRLVPWWRRRCVATISALAVFTTLLMDPGCSGWKQCERATADSAIRNLAASSTPTAASTPTASTTDQHGAVEDWGFIG